jgi:hypothetical protein
MDQVVAQALTVYSHICGVNRAEAISMKVEPKVTTVTFPALVRKAKRVDRSPVQRRAVLTTAS